MKDGAPVQWCLREVADSLFVLAGTEVEACVPLGGISLPPAIRALPLAYARAFRMLFGQMPCLPGDRIPFGSRASFIVSWKRQSE